MSIRAAGQKQLVIVGATGMVGGYALRYALDHPAVGRVTSIGRKKLGLSHHNLVETLHKDFADCSPLAEALSGQDAAIFCMGAYTGAVPDAEFRTITVNYPIEFARVLRGNSPNVAFSFLSGSGADPTGRSRMAFRTIQGRGRESAARGRVPLRLHISAGVYLPYGTAQGTKFQLPTVAGYLPGVSSAVSQSSGSCR